MGGSPGSCPLGRSLTPQCGIPGTWLESHYPGDELHLVSDAECFQNVLCQGSFHCYDRKVSPKQALSTSPSLPPTRGPQPQVGVGPEPWGTRRPLMGTGVWGLSSRLLRPSAAWPGPAGFPEGSLPWMSSCGGPSARACGPCNAGPSRSLPSGCTMCWARCWTLWSSCIG